MNDQVWLTQMPLDEFEAFRGTLVDPMAQPVVTVNRYRKEIKAGAPMWLWVSGRKNPGIYGALVTTTDPQLPQAGFIHFGGVTQETDRPWIGVRPLVLFDRPILKEDLKRFHPELENLSVIRAPQGSLHKVNAAHDELIREAVRESLDHPDPWPPTPPPRIMPDVARALRDSGRYWTLEKLAESEFHSPMLAFGRWIRDRIEEATGLWSDFDYPDPLNGGLWVPAPDWAAPEAEACLDFALGFNYGLNVVFEHDRLSWGLYPRDIADGLEHILRKRAVQDAAWETVSTCKPGLQWTSWDQERDQSVHARNDGSFVQLGMAEGLPTWAASEGAPVVRASVPYSDMRAITSPDLAQWIAADLSRLAALVLAADEQPIEVTPIDYPLPATDRRRAEPLIFISYTRSDNASGLITRLRDALEQTFPTRVFMDDRIPKGAQWRQHLRDRLTEAAMLIVAVSDDAMESEVVEWEINTFLDQLEDRSGGKPGALLPIRVSSSRFDDRNFARTAPKEGWKRLAAFNAPNGYLEREEPDAFLPAIEETYGGLRARFREFYALPGNLERLEGHDTVSPAELTVLVQALADRDLSVEDLLDALPIIEKAKRASPTHLPRRSANS